MMKPVAGSQVEEIRHWLVWLLGGGEAHVKFENAIKDFSPGLRGKKPRDIPYSAWQLLEHMRIAQADILDFCVNPDYKEREWPAAFWPKQPRPPDESAWDKCVHDFRADLRRVQELVEDPKTDLFGKIPWGTGQTMLRQALLVADHNSYHLGELVLLRRVLGVWPG
jgi:hypothetical protein